LKIGKSVTPVVKRIGVGAAGRLCKSAGSKIFAVMIMLLRSIPNTENQTVPGLRPISAVFASGR
jgi:hypothetical protein